MKAEWSNKDSLEMPTTTTSDYIKKEDVIQEVIYELDAFDHVPQALIDKIKRDVDTLPTADVVEARHGKWSHDYIKDGMKYNDWFNLHCSVCGEMQRDTWGKWNYCPYCGAKMDGEEQEHE